MKTCSVYIGIRTGTRQRINVQQFIAVEVFICLFIFDYKALFVCVKDRTCLRIAIPVYCFNIFGSIFVVLFSLLIKKLILGNKTTWQSMRNFPCTFSSVRAFPDMDKEEIFFSRKLHIGIVWLFLDNYLFIRPKNLKTTLKT